MIYINESKSNNRNGRIGWILTEAAPDPTILQKPKIKVHNDRRVVAECVFREVI